MSHVAAPGAPSWMTSLPDQNTAARFEQKAASSDGEDELSEGTNTTASPPNDAERLCVPSMRVEPANNQCVRMVVLV
jgi:hypothetical protein